MHLFCVSMCFHPKLLSMHLPYANAFRKSFDRCVCITAKQYRYFVLWIDCCRTPLCMYKLNAFQLSKHMHVAHCTGNQSSPYAKMHTHYSCFKWGWILVVEFSSLLWPALVAQKMSICLSLFHRWCGTHYITGMFSFNLCETAVENWI